MSPQNRSFTAVFTSIVGIAGVVGMLLFGAIQTSFPFWVDAILYLLAAAFLLLGGYGLYLLIEKQPEPKQPIFSVRLPEPPKAGQIDSYKTVWFDKVLITKRSHRDRVLRFYLSMPGREFVDLGEFQQIYQERPYIHSAYHSNPLDLPNNTQKVLAFVLTPGPDGGDDTFELSIRDIQSDHSFTISALGEYVCYDDGSVDLATDSPVSPADPERERIRAWEDLEARLSEIVRNENAAYREVDRDTQERGVYRSGIRPDRYVAIAEEHDRQREGAVRDWRRRVEDAGIDDVAEPPISSAVRPSNFVDDELTFDRRWLGREPLVCGWCGRLAYAATDGGGEYWWCPEHKDQIS